MPHPDPDGPLDPRLEADTLPLGTMAVARLRLMDDARYPWVVLVPRRPDLVELTDLAPAERHVLMDEIAAVSTALRETTGCEKLNVGALGNIVRQLHIHVIARFAGDAAWPSPVWGVGARVPYEAAARDHLIGEVRRRLGLIAAA